MNLLSPKIFLLFEILPRLGFWNVAYMAYYRLSLKLGLRKHKFIRKKMGTGLFFIADFKEQTTNLTEISRKNVLASGQEIIDGTFTYYNHHKFQLGVVPNWFYDPFSSETLTRNDKHWVDIKEFELNTGDIKNLWEISRFNWVTDLARAYSAEGDQVYLERLNFLLCNWTDKNPLNTGINWRCGQETSIRIIRLFNASLVFNNVFDITAVLAQFVFDHLQRIDGNIRYAVAQDNNHGTTEAAALYIGSLWLLNQNSRVLPNVNYQKLKAYQQRGRRILERRLRRLILKDGTFAQKSVNYHRVVVDTMSFVLHGMNLFQEKEFNRPITDKLTNLGEWLFHMVCNSSGEVPNLGANDGAMFENLHSCDYRDFRPSLQLFFALNSKCSIWEDSLVNEPLLWRGISTNDEYVVIPRHRDFNRIFDGEFVQMKENGLIVRVKATQNNFRPQNDVLHLDVWYKGVNVLLDTGSYSYNSKLSSYFKSIKAHNTLQFGDEEPMPRISRFLNGKWIKVVGDEEINDTAGFSTWTGHYKDFRGNYHERKVVVSKKYLCLTIEDTFESTTVDQCVKLHYHLPSNSDKFLSLACYDETGAEMRVKKSISEHSLYYMSKEEHSLYTVETKASSGKFVTKILFH